MSVRRVRQTAWFVVALVGVALAGLCAVWLVVFREPLVQGRSAAAWIRELRQGGNREHDAVVQVFRREGANAVPGLVSVIDRRRSVVGSWLRRLPFHEAMPRRIQDWAFEHTDLQELDRIWAIRMCALIGREAGGCHRALRRALSDDSAFVRGAAARALAQTGADPATAVARIGSLLADPEPGTRSQAALALGCYRGAALPMLAQLRSLTNDSVGTVAFSAQAAVAMIEAPDRVTVTTNGPGGIGIRLER